MIVMQNSEMGVEVNVGDGVGIDVGWDISNWLIYTWK